MLLAAPASAYTDADYCTDTLRAERQACHAQHLADLADCTAALAFDRWVDVPYSDAAADAKECRAEADATCRDCKAAVFCEAVSQRGTR